MSTLYGSEIRRTVDAPASPEDALLLHGAGVYLTDEVFLYRVVRFVAGESGEAVELEDCYRLDVVRVPVNGLRARRLRVVMPTPLEA